MGLKSNFELMAKYNQWMNQSLYGICGELSAAQLAKDRGAFFTSVLGTLNHILVGDIIWLKRFLQHSSFFKSLEIVNSLNTPSSLSQELYSDYKELLKVREMVDAAIVDFSLEASETDYEQTLSYTNTKGVTLTHPFSFLVHHFFNHQTHHRGQLTTLFNQMGLDVGMTDLLAVMPDQDKPV